MSPQHAAVDQPGPLDWIRLRYWAICAHFSIGAISRKAIISRQAVVKGPHSSVLIGPGTSVHPYAQISTLRGGGRIRIGSNCEIHTGTMVQAYGGQIEIGENCSFNPYCVIYGHGGLTVGHNVRIATHAVIIPSNHIFDDPRTPIYKQGEVSIGINIKDDVWIGAGAIVLDGVTIGRGSIVGAGSVVTKSIDDFTVAAGNPCRAIRKRFVGSE